MGIIQKDSIKSTIISYFGLFLGYLNKGVLFVYILTTEQIGLINLILSLSVLFAQFSNFGVLNSIIKFNHFFTKKIVVKRYFLKYLFKIIFFGVIVATSLFIVFDGFVTGYYSKNSKLFVDYYYWVIPLGIANITFISLEAYLRANFNNIISVFLNDILLRGMVSFSLLILLFKWINFEQFFILHTVIYFIPVLILLIYTFNKYPLRSNKITSTAKSEFNRYKKIILKYSFYNHSNTIGTLFVLTLDGMMITYFLNLEATGVYTTMLYLTSALLVPYKALMRITYPFIPLYWKEKNSTKMNQLYKDTGNVSFIVTGLLSALFFVNIDHFFNLLPANFLIGKNVFLILMIGKIVDVYLGLNGWILVTSKNYAKDIYFTVTLLIIAFFMNLFLIPKYGLLGAAIATSIAIILYNIFRSIYIYKIYSLSPFDKSHFKSFFLMGILFSLNYWEIGNFFISLFVKSILIISVFLIFILKFNLSEDLKRIVQSKINNMSFKKLKS